MNERILILSDLHVPYQHVDAFDFLQACKEKIKPTRIINSGDSEDFHSISFHDHDPDLPSSGDELDKIREIVSGRYSKMFPVMDILDSNHGSMVLRKALSCGLSRKFFKTPQEIICAPAGWQYHMDLTIELPNKEWVYLHHGKSKNAMTVSQQMGMSFVEGHFHENFSINYWQTPVGQHFAMQVGALIDHKSLSMAYARNNIKAPFLGTGCIVGGVPLLLPMIVNKANRWIGRL